VASEIIAALIGAGIALVGGIVGAFLQHFLSLRTDRIKRERDAREEKVRGLREKQNQADKNEKDRTEREIDRLREVLLESVSSRLAAQDLEKFLEEVERKYDEDGLRWAERSRETLGAWLTERLQESIEEPNSQEEKPVEISD
jgi:C-terminal processing protease CtpA/Prc